MNESWSTIFHFIELCNQDVDIFYYMLSFVCQSGMTQDGFESKRFCSIASKDKGVISGTFIKGADAQTPNYDEFDVVVDNAKEFFGIKD